MRWAYKQSRGDTTHLPRLHPLQDADGVEDVDENLWFNSHQATAWPAFLLVDVDSLQALVLVLLNLPTQQKEQGRRGKAGSKAWVLGRRLVGLGRR